MSDSERRTPTRQPDHSFQRCKHSGAGNCWCGLSHRSKKHKDNPNVDCDDDKFCPCKMPKCGCPPRPPGDTPWEETCAWHVEHYTRAMTGDKGHKQGHPKVCEMQRDKWLDAITTHRELRPDKTHRLTPHAQGAS